MNKISIIAISLLSLLPTIVFGQTRVVFNGSVKASNEALCRSKAGLIRSQRTDQEGTSALKSMTQCPDTGAALLAEKWRSHPTDTVYLGQLREYSRVLNDKRIADALVAIVENKNADLELRRGALDALASQLNPNVGIRLGAFLERPARDIKPPHNTIPGRTTRIITGTQIWFPTSFVAGRNEIDAAGVLQLEEQLKRVAATDSVLGPHIPGVISLAKENRKPRDPR